MQMVRIGEEDKGIEKVGYMAGVYKVLTGVLELL